MKKNITRPNKVSIAIKLLYLALIIGAIRSIFEIFILTQTESINFIIFIILFVLAILAILAFFIYTIERGRNWARIIFLILSIVSIPFSISPLLQSLITNPIFGVIEMSQIGLEITALVFLFQKSSNKWFRLMNIK